MSQVALNLDDPGQLAGFLMGQFQGLQNLLARTRTAENGAAVTDRELLMGLLESQCALLTGLASGLRARAQLVQGQRITLAGGEIRR